MPLEDEIVLISSVFTGLPISLTEYMNDTLWSIPSLLMLIVGYSRGPGFGRKPKLTVP